MFGSAVAGRICSIEGNNVCADCGCSSPRWASVNIGVLLCINCSGVHRMLGVHISQVKSLTLDNLRPEWTKVLLEVGNDLANQYYLYKLPARVPKPNANTSPRDMEIWIRNKYERKIYAMDGVEEPYILLAKGYNPREVISRGAVPVSRPQTSSVERAPKDGFDSAFSNPGPDFHGANKNRPTPVSEDLFGTATVQNTPFDAFPDSGTAPKWSGDFWPTASANAANANSFDNMIHTVGSSSSFDSSKLAETKIEAAKDCISKMFDNPGQIGFKNTSYQQNTPSCVQEDLFDFNFTSLSSKLESQKHSTNDLI